MTLQGIYFWSHTEDIWAMHPCHVHIKVHSLEFSLCDKAIMPADVSLCSKDQNYGIVFVSYGIGIISYWYCMVLYCIGIIWYCII